MAFDNDQREITQGDEDNDDILTTLFFSDKLFSLVSSSFTLTDNSFHCAYSLKIHQTIKIDWN